VAGGRALGAAVLGYVAGTLPSADLAARLAARRREAVDLRSSGSGNPGAANAIALLGPRWGYGVMAADIAKGALAAVAGRRLAGGTGAHTAGVAAVVGHCYPVWNGFRGGKGVAASVGQCVATFPAWTVPDLALAGAVAGSPWWRRRALAATAASSGAWTAAALVWWRRGWPNLWGPPPTAALPLAAAASSAVILARFAASRPAPAAFLAQKRPDVGRDCAQSASTPEEVVP
jgi:acyl phosphate:glycerol-3-phosphate acyltransferase